MQRVGIIGLGGLVHMESSLPLHLVDPNSLARAGKFDFILDTVSAKHELSVYINLLVTKGVLALVGKPFVLSNTRRCFSRAIHCPRHVSYFWKQDSCW